MKDPHSASPQQEPPAEPTRLLSRVDSTDLGGDPVCWAPRVCPDCGFFVPLEPPTVCPRCGGMVGVD